MERNKVNEILGHDAKFWLFVRHVLVGFKYRHVQFVKEGFGCRKEIFITLFCNWLKTSVAQVVIGQ